MVVSTGWGANLRFPLELMVVVSMGSGTNLRLALELVVVVSKGSGANLRLALELDVVVSMGCGANLRGLGASTCSSLVLSLEDETVVSMGSGLKRLGGAVVAILAYSNPGQMAFYPFFVGKNVVCASGGKPPITARRCGRPDRLTTN